MQYPPQPPAAVILRLNLVSAELARGKTVSGRTVPSPQQQAHPLGPQLSPGSPDNLSRWLFTALLALLLFRSLLLCRLLKRAGRSIAGVIHAVFQLSAKSKSQPQSRKNRTLDTQHSCCRGLHSSLHDSKLRHQYVVLLMAIQFCMSL
jgi:hypothetical protein